MKTEISVFAERRRSTRCGYGGMADALDLGSSSKECRFKSCYPHQMRALRTIEFGWASFFLKIYKNK